MEGIEALMRHIYVFPLIGLALGLIFGASAYILGPALPPAIVAVFVLAVIYKLCGINHIDGLADFGDGLTAHGGTVEKKVQAMKDVNLGTGGGLFIAMLLLASFAAMANLPREILPLALVTAEVSAKEAMITFGAFSKSFQKGFGQMMIERARSRDFVIGGLISTAICVGLMGPLGGAMLIVSVISALYLVLVSKRNFGGGSGDGLGATNEISRVLALATALALMEVLPWTPW